MAPRSAVSPAVISSRESTGPYTRRSSSQPKSSRQQFSACGACRMRRVRCDLKDLPVGSVGPHTACSNCTERGIRCVDEFADVKAVKLLRRGRRLQQVEAIYGKLGEESAGLQPNRVPVIPALRPEFFSSPFWSWFTVQRPLLDASEFPASYTAHVKGTKPLEHEGTLIAMLLVTWAASFGLDERGQPAGVAQYGDSSTLVDGPVGPTAGHGDYGNHSVDREGYALQKNKTQDYLRDVLEFIDLHGFLRRPSLSSVQALLLLLPLLENADTMEQLAIHEATMSQVHALLIRSPSCCTFDDAAAHARIFWYAYTHEGITTGLRGGRVLLDEDDLVTFRRKLDLLDLGAEPLSSIIFPRGGIDPSPQDAYVNLLHLTATPLELSNTCRLIHRLLTSEKALQRIEETGVVDATGMREVWRNLDRCWTGLETMKSVTLEHAPRCVEGFQYSAIWQIFIFNCHNTIRETLRQLLDRPLPPPELSDSPHKSDESFMTLHQLHAVASEKCHSQLPSVLRILQLRNVHERHESPAFLCWDSGLIRDGCLFAGILVAKAEGELVWQEERGDRIPSNATGGLAICLEALQRMDWLHSKKEEREGTIRTIYQEAHSSNRRPSTSTLPTPPFTIEYSRPADFPSQRLESAVPPSTVTLLPNTRPMLSLVNEMNLRRIHSAPSTASSTDGRGPPDWLSYTPPSTATSVATSAGTGFGGGSPVFDHMPAFKTDEMFYNELDQFSYHAPLTGPARDTSTIPYAVTRRPSSEPYTTSADTEFITRSYPLVIDTIDPTNQQYRQSCDAGCY